MIMHYRLCCTMEVSHNNRHLLPRTLPLGNQAISGFFPLWRKKTRRQCLRSWFWSGQAPCMQCLGCAILEPTQWELTRSESLCLIAISRRVGSALDRSWEETSGNHRRQLWSRAGCHTWTQLSEVIPTRIVSSQLLPLPSPWGTSGLYRSLLQFLNAADSSFTVDLTSTLLGYV